MSNYRELDGENQSRLKLMLKNPQAYSKNKSVKTDYFAFGSLVDFLLTEKDKDLEDEFYVLKDIKISDNVKKIVDKIFDYYETFSETIVVDPTKDVPLQNKEMIIEFAKELEYGQNWKPETLIAKLQEAGQPYYDILQEAKGKTKISEEDYYKAVNCKMAVMSDPKLSKYFKSEKSKDLTINTEVIFKKILDFEYEGFHCKGELDQIHIDHNAKTITPIDEKTTAESVLSFNYNFWKYRYDFQASFYTEGLKRDKELQPLFDQGYTLEPFKFIVIEKELINRPVIFTTTNTILHIGKYGGVLANGKEIEGFHQAIQRLRFHQESNNWEFPKEYYDNDEEFILTI
jgi:hypothetical protein